MAAQHGDDHSVGYVEQTTHIFRLNESARIGGFY